MGFPGYDTSARTSMRKISDPRVGRQSHVENEVNEASLSFAQRTALRVADEYPVFPCDPISKRPLTEHGFKEASQEAKQIVKWWKAYPDALVGVPTGSASGLIAVDVDPRGKGWFESQKPRLGHYRMHGTRRGKHLLYRMNGQAIRNSTSELADGVDTRGEGGYIVWWPAHGGIAIGEPGELPRWLETKLASNGTKVGSGPSEVEPEDSRDVRTFSEGERSDALSKRAYYYHRMGMSTKEAEAALLKYDLERCRPPYQQTDGKYKVLYIARKKAHLKTDAQAAEPDPNTRLTSAAMEDIPEERVDWLWKGFLARNKVHVIAGAGATMKSTLTLSLAATVTTGGTWPDGTECRQGNVILWTGEDDLGDTVKPRFRWAGGDQSRCHVLTGVEDGGGSRPFDPGKDLALLDKACAKIGDVSLIIVDPIVVIVQKDNNSVSDVRRALYPLQKMAEKHNCVILGIQHFNKGSKGKDPVERITGSGAWSQAPRIILATAPINTGDGADPTDYVFACTKTFAKKQHGGYEYTFEEEPKTEIARIKWGKRLEGTGLSIITEAEGGEDGESKIGNAKRILKDLMRKGPVFGMQITKACDAEGIHSKTVERAKKALGIVMDRAGNQRRYRLPDDFYE